MVFCPECGTEIEDNAKFCTECGTKIIVIENELDKTSISTIKCPSCRTENDREQPSCWVCGRDLTNTLAFFQGGYSSNGMWRMNKDIEITPDEVIMYKRSHISGKQKKKLKEISSKRYARYRNT